MARKMLGSLTQTLLSWLGEPLQKLVLDAVQRAIRGFLKRLALAILGTLLASFGIICFMLGFLKYLAILMPEWQAWAITGVIMLLAGLLALSISLPRRLG